MATVQNGNPSSPGQVPKDWLPGLAENWKTDVMSGFVLFLIALPLCLGIAIASGVPPIAGIITGIVAGVLVGFLSGSYVTINGPAAGMIVIVLGAVQELGAGDPMLGYRLALAVGVVAGAIQIILGILKAGKLTGFFAASVIHGMLAGIGFIIMAGQIHAVLGRVNPREHGLGILTSIPPSFANFNPYVAAIGVTAILIMILWPKLGKIAKFVPAPLVAVIVGIVMAKGLGIGADLPYTSVVPDIRVAEGEVGVAAQSTYEFWGSTYQAGREFLLQLPEGGLLAGLTTPDFSQVFTATSIKWIVLFVFVASLESLLTAEAVDQIDPWKRRSNMNRELLGKGVGNSVSSMLGGLPMIAEVVRSKANILQGARTRWSNFFHGLFLFIFVLLVPDLLAMIPLAALAGILVVIGFRLAHPKEFMHALHVGKTEFAFMLVTALIVLLTDLLIGVATGMVLAFIVAMTYGRTKPGNLFKPRVQPLVHNGSASVRFAGALGFHNFLGIRSKLDDLPKGKRVALDFSDAHYIDHTVMARLETFKREYTQDGGEVEFTGMDHLSSDGHDPLSPRRGIPAAATT